MRMKNEGVEAGNIQNEHTLSMSTRDKHVDSTKYFDKDVF